MKTENWNGHSIRFIEKSQGDWWAVAQDVATALAYRDAHNMVRLLGKQDRGTQKVRSTSGKAKSRDTQDLLIISEFGIYDAIFRSNKPEAKAFKRWVYEVIQTLRQESGLAGFEVFRMLDKEHQKQAMQNLKDSLANPVRKDFIKANTIANKTVSNIHGLPKMVKKSEMSPAMLKKREAILDDTITLMGVNDSFGLGLSVSEAVYQKHCNLH